MKMFYVDVVIPTTRKEKMLEKKVENGIDKWNLVEDDSYRLQLLF